MKRPKILLVDDEVLLSMMLENQLAAAGYELCRSACTGPEALERAIRERPELIIMDIHLASGMDGIETARQILAQMPVQLIFVTGYQDTAYKTQAMALRPLGFLNKPIQFCDLEHLLLRACAEAEGPAPGTTGVPPA